MSDVRCLVRVNPSTLHRDLEGEGVLLQVETGEYYGLDAVGERFWELIVEHGDLKLVEQALLQEYNVDPTVLAGDLRHMVDELVEKQLLDIGDRDGSHSAGGDDRSPGGAP